MPCLNCNATKTIEAHLIPKTFVSEVKSGNGEQHLILHQGLRRPVVSHTGVYDRNMLCGACDALLGEHENYAVKLLRRLRNVEGNKSRLATVDPVDGDRMVKFAAGIAWKYANTTPERGRIAIGPYVDLLRDVALRGAPIPSSIDVTMIRLFELDGNVYFYRAPMLSRQGGANMVRFCVGSFLFFLKIDKRGGGLGLPAECWLRERTHGAYAIMPADHFEEGRIHRSLATGAAATKFFGDMRVRQRGRV